MGQSVNETPASILIIDDHPLLRRGVAQLLELEDDLELVGDTGEPQQGVGLAAELDPDMILLDLNMPGMDGIQTLKALRDSGYAGRIVMFTVSDHEDDLVAALRGGADGYLLKDMEPEEMVRQLRQAALGRMVVSESLTALLAEALRNQRTAPATPDIHSLTQREREILRELAGGLSNKLIARKLDISEGTVKVHVKHLLKKLNLRSRVEAAVWAVQEGIDR
ncbi:two-component system response regulator NarL [Halomonas daqingensis]|uniref:Two-component system response regulator NarL n=2 Tax=Billgrantia desiderata TaxID=52021 RepID=A0ABS9B9R1_9GAMM|nr:two-component system response regulator NarL [Halomonas desiderata]MCE8011988.1 two-component system response regulator NarL [Halomonas desiderata]MCE8030459.1 two-component system response regulator NarL [Halomonas desiderata]MCE8044064.1 two-component system response regulator NarL [Halomonas desiderata]MCE8048638.1 two-component system response regulator NarL [Halomonas desiderata]OUE40403.1 two-component system response regulator NarL [Halomonas desiderata SP1]